MRVHDLVGVGVGPANLGLACLAAPLDLDAVFLEAEPSWSWHPGMLLPSATLQTPFLADLVTLADPTSPYSFLSYLKQVDRLYAFYIRESFFPLRREYDDYCRWAAEQLPSVRFGEPVSTVRWEQGAYTVVTPGTSYRARNVVVGTGSRPSVPTCVAGLDGWLHSSQYLSRRAELQDLRHVTVVGSGQSAAEVFHDLLQSGVERLTWVTRSPRFFPLEYTKLTLEMTSPDYVDYYHALPLATRERLLGEQRGLSKGIDADLINAVFDLLYEQRVSGGPTVQLLTGTSLVGASGSFTLALRHDEQERSFVLETDGLVLATGYDDRLPPCLDELAPRLLFEPTGRPAITRDYAIGEGVYLQNGGQHLFSVTSPDLGMCAYRNSVILRAVTGHEAYPVEKRIAFQQFGAPA